MVRCDTPSKRTISSLGVPRSTAASTVALDPSSKPSYPNSLTPINYRANCCRRDVTGKEQAAERVAKDLERMSRERISPRVEVLDKVARYEAHLSRQLYKAMHELEALQTRRLGRSAPLARLDVDGMAES